MGLFGGQVEQASLNYEQTCNLLCGFVQKKLQELPWSGIL